MGNGRGGARGPFSLTLLPLLFSASFTALTDEQHLHGHMTQFGCRSNSCHVDTVRNARDFLDRMRERYYPTGPSDYSTLVVGVYSSALSRAEHIYISGFGPTFLSTETHDEWGRVAPSNLLKDVSIGNMAAAGIKTLY